MYTINKKLIASIEANPILKNYIDLSDFKRSINFIIYALNELRNINYIGLPIDWESLYLYCYLNF